MAPEDRDLNDRSQQLLKTLIEAYIRDGLPVGSRTLSRDSGLSLSAATVRNVMSDLEDLGYVRSPHTSASNVIPKIRQNESFTRSRERRSAPVTVVVSRTSAAGARTSVT